MSADSSVISRRRFFLSASATLLCTPALVRPASLMRLRGIILPTERNYYGFVDRLYVSTYLPTIRKCQDSGLSAHGIAVELNNRGSRSMNGETWDAGNVFGVIKRDESIRLADAIIRAERLFIGPVHVG